MTLYLGETAVSVGPGKRQLLLRALDAVTHSEPDLSLHAVRGLARAAGAPDNIACAVADVMAL